MNSWNLILATVVIFGTGVITGGLLVDHVNQHHSKSNHPAAASTTVTNHPPVLRSEDFFNGHQTELFKKDVLQKMDDQLQLNPTQRESIHNILAAGQAQNRELWDNWVAQSRQVSQEARLHIRELLNTDQRKQFEQLLRQMRPPARKPAGTNSVPGVPAVTNGVPLLPATNDLVLKSTNVVSN